MRRLLPLALITLLGGAAPPGSEASPSFDRKLSEQQRIEHALNRLTFGPQPGSIDEVNRIGLKTWIDRQLHPERIVENPVLESKLKPLESLPMTPDEAVRQYPPRQAGQAAAAARPITQILSAGQLATLRTGSSDDVRELIASLPDGTWVQFAAALPRAQRQRLLNSVPEPLRRDMIRATAPAAVLNYDLAEAKIYRAVYSHRQLAEVLADFWFNHFNVYFGKGPDRYMIAAYERDAIRPHILGRFRDLLEATAKSPAMLFYLDNWQSAAPKSNARRSRGLNENYARELMELHTLGADGGYTQKDIQEVARCFTGWTIRNPRLGGPFEYNDRMHDKGEKTVLGVTIPPGGGMSDGERVLDILARHPATARFISRKLAVRFVSDTPPEKLVDRMARTFTRTDGNLRAVVKAMFESKEFWSAGAYRAKVKTPLELVVSAVRAAGVEVDYAFPLANQVARLGEPLYRKMEPTGYSSANSEWLNSGSLVGRMNFALALARNTIPGLTPLRMDLFDGAPGDVKASIEKAVARESAHPSPAVLNGLVLGSPEFQRR